MSSKNWLKFLSIHWFSFAGLHKGQKVDVTYPEGFEPKYQPDPENGIVVFFPPEHRYVEASGDQGVGKSSFLSMVKEAAGHLALGRFINRKDDSKKYTEEFETPDGRLYRVVATKTQFDLFEIMKDENGNSLKDPKGREITSRVGTPKDMVKKMVGPAGKSPLEVAAMDPAKQVEWFRTVVKLAPDQLALENELKNNINTTYEKRKKANAKTNELTKVLENNPYYREYEKWMNFFNEDNTNRYKNVDQEIKDVQQRHSDYMDQHRLSLELHETKQELANDIENIQEQIKRLHERLANTQQEYVKVEDQIQKVDLYLVQNKTVLTEYESSTQLVREASEYFQQQGQFNAMIEKLQEYNTASDLAINLDGKLEELRKLKKDFDVSVTPAVEGLEVVTPTEDDKREGAFYKQMPLEMLAESEQWEWYTQLAKCCGIRVMYIENISSLGSGSIAKFNEFIEQGGYVFATRMDVEQKNLRVTFSTKVPTYKSTVRKQEETIS